MADLSYCYLGTLACEFRRPSLRAPRRRRVRPTNPQIVTASCSLFFPRDADRTKQLLYFFLSVSFQYFFLDSLQWTSPLHQVLTENLDPFWNQTFDFVVEDGLYDMLMLGVYDHDTFRGCILTSTQDLIKEDCCDGFLLAGAGESIFQVLGEAA